MAKQQGDESQENQGTDAPEQNQQGSEQQKGFSELDSKLDALSGLIDTTALVAEIEKERTALGAKKKPEEKKPEKKVPATTGTENQENAEEEEEPEEGKEGKKKPAAGKKQGEEEEEQEEEPENGKKSRLFKPSKKGSEVKIENFEDVIPVIQSRFGMANIKEAKDLPAFIDQSLTWRADAQKFKKVQADFEDLKTSIESLPPEFTEAITAFATGKDYTEPFKQKSKFNFTVPVEKQDMKSLVNHYYPGKFTDVDFEEAEPSEKLEIAISASKDKFVFEKEKYDGKRAQIVDNAQRSLQALKASVTSSVSHLKQSFPDTDDDTLKEIESMFEGGSQGVMSLFFNKDGTAKPEAAKLAFMAKYGEEEIEIAQRKAARKAESKTNEDILTRGADGKKPVQKNTGANTQISEETKQRLAEFEQHKKRKQTF